ncbi:GAF domain-containing protein [Ruegeria aquimaris]|uniref:GAF domain-containing protein n=1 Tax=Ruegeria aquimaris TaxID=2984333 RepID=A0ABT3AHL1_9RHOB|nr:GAF domain-containing protein [Ruegeria sp. XHP0148]MCV2888077.1 GAF domain-containing protein [Ruegeria sp. XHP0148]
MTGAQDLASYTSPDTPPHRSSGSAPISEREQALHDILGLLHRSRADAQPVFEAILERSAHLSGAPLANLCLLNAARSHWHLVAHFGEGLRHLSVGTAERPLDSHLVPAVTMRTARVVHIEDLIDTDLYRQGDPGRVAMVESEGMRTILCVPLLTEAGSIGCITLFRREVQAFTDDEIRLIETFAAQAVIAIENVRQFREVQTRLERERASAEVLEVISQSRDDEAPVFAAILENAARLCNAPMADLDLVDADGRHLREVAAWGPVDREIGSENWVWPMDSDYSHVVAVRTGQIAHVADAKDSDRYRAGDPVSTAVVDVEGIRTFLAVPLIANGYGIGCLVLFRQEVHPFSADEIALVETFAAQAVIAIENVRQFREVQERLRRERASAEILEVISQSRENEKPVFDAILENACALCNAPLAGLILGTPQDATQTLAAHKGMFEAAIQLFESGQMRMDANLSYAAKSIIESRLIAFEDMGKSDLYDAGSPIVRSMVDASGIRSVLFVPLIKDGQSIGNLTLFRREVKPFDQSEISLVETFAAQAVIAIENVRQFREVQERLERETASRDILYGISQSRENERPVLRQINETAMRLCGATESVIWVIAGDRFVLGDLASDDESLLRVVQKNPIPLDRRSAGGRAVEDRVPVQILDLMADPTTSQLPATKFAKSRSLLAVPLISKDGTPIGAITVFRREVRAFTQDQIALTETFAAQAVIAIENVRQFREVQERLERERASAEILEVISQSRDDETPVFEAILSRAARLCSAVGSVLLLLDENRNVLKLRAEWSTLENDLETDDVFLDVNGESLAAEAVRTGKSRAVGDLTKEASYTRGDTLTRRFVDATGIRSMLSVPLLLNGVAVGCIDLFRHEAASFKDRDIALVETFAAQAVIAIENVRQFREVQERLEREKASGEILGVISQSRDDETPVFDAILENACRLCDAPLAFLSLLEDTGTHFRVPAHRGASPEMARVWNTQTEPIEGSTLTTSQSISERRIIQVDDLAAVTAPDTADGRRAQLVQLEQVRSYLVIPLIRGAQAIGTINLYRREVRPFTPDQIALVETFAAQAVIAIENVRQFKALEALNAELESRVEDQVGEIERMGRLKRFLPAAVADTVISSGSEKMLSSHRALLGVLFCDIRGFTAFCETAEPEETIEVLQTYHQEMGKLINEHGAGVDHRMGDGIMVLFNDPVPCDDPAGEAVRLALAMRERMADLCRGWKRLGHRLGFGVGVAMGYATVGMVGYEGRFDYTASGTAVNLAARLCDEAEDGEILLSPRASIAVEDDYAVESKGEVTLKGIREPVEIFRLASG